MNANTSAPAHILLIEDNPADVEITRQAFASLEDFEHRIAVVPDGQTAIDYLQNAGDYATAQRPDLILLDLNLPGIDGRSVLAHLKSDERLRLIPTVVLSSSSAPADIQAAYHLHANSYLTKPIDFREFVALIAKVCDYWFVAVTRP